MERLVAANVLSKKSSTHLVCIAMQMGRDKISQSHAVPPYGRMFASNGALGYPEVFAEDIGSGQDGHGNRQLGNMPTSIGPQTTSNR